MADGEMSSGPAGMPSPGPAPAVPQGSGSSPAAMPVANRGAQAAGLPKAAVAIKIAEAARMSFPPGSDIWRDFGKAIELMAKHVGEGAVSGGVMNTELQKLQQQQRQTAANSALMRGMQSGGQAAPPPPQPMAA